MTSFLSMHSEFGGRGTDTPTLSSSIVVKSLIDAHNRGLKFRVIVVDSRPKLEGKSEKQPKDCVIQCLLLLNCY